MENSRDMVNSPNHYKLEGLDIEAKDVIRSVLGSEGYLAYCHGNIIKYILRANKKNLLEDFKKARVYTDYYIEESERTKAT